MYTRLILVNIGPGNAGKWLADTFAPIYKTMEGFRGATFFHDPETGECGSLTLWESREDAEAATANLRPKLLEVTHGMLKGSPTVRVFELYEPMVFDYEHATPE